MLCRGSLAYWHNLQPACKADEECTRLLVVGCSKVPGILTTAGILRPRFSNLVSLSLSNTNAPARLRLHSLPSLRFLDLTGCNVVTVQLCGTGNLQGLLLGNNM
jgi:hypothetical protein